MHRVAVKQSSPFQSLRAKNLDSAQARWPAIAANVDLQPGQTAMSRHNLLKEYADESHGVRQSHAEQRKGPAVPGGNAEALRGNGRLQREAGEGRNHEGR